jgi:hypothetical protein
MGQTRLSYVAQVLVVVALLWSGTVAADSVSTTSKNFIVSYDFDYLHKIYAKRNLGKDETRRKINKAKSHAARILPLVTEDAEQALKDVTAFLNTSYAGKIKILISAKYRFPRSTSKDATLRIPQNRLSVRGSTQGGKFLRGRGATLWNGVTNIVAAPGHPRKAWGRFLQEGLGSFMQEKFGGKKQPPWPSKFYPTMGEDMHLSTVKQIAKFDGPFSLENARNGVHRRRLDRTRRLAMTMAGSFVRFLLENRGGVERFMVWYKGGSFQKAYGKSLGTIEADWRKFLASREF